MLYRILCGRIQNWLSNVNSEDVSNIYLDSERITERSTEKSDVSDLNETTEISDYSYVTESVDISLEKECCICLEDIIDEDLILPCNHRYHISCIIKWTVTQIKRNGPSSSTKCPYCKSTYNYKILSQTILFNFRKKVKNNLTDLNLILDKCKFNKTDKKHLINYIKIYKKIQLHISYKYIPNICHSPELLLDITFPIIPENFLNLIDSTKIQVKENQENQENQKNNENKRLIVKNYKRCCFSLWK